eukprot:TRINITY_DN10368_c0_g5_i1.p1 TRINITY_DN10368_c0_g5~~TRINITY_DN10368_c0_g5_i1.p1  ORF type:complete len:355 (+),score=54.75 TRINITY_DN10368_c0_g5_i1:27-1067(+)
MIRRPPRSTHCISSAASDVYKRQVHGILRRMRILIFFIAQYVFTAVHALTNTTERPIIGMLTTPVSERFKGTIGNYTEIIEGKNAHFIEGGGGRLFPISFKWSKDKMKEALKSINGIFFPDSDVGLFSEDNTYLEAARTLIELAKSLNDEGVYFPVWGTARGFELLILIESNASILQPCSSCKSHNANLIFTPSKGKLHQTLSDQQINALTHQTLTYFDHNHSIAKSSFEESESQDKNKKLSAKYEVVAHSAVLGGEELIVAEVQGRSYPFYGVAYNPGSWVYEWRKEVVKTVETMWLGNAYSNFFVDECKRNGQGFGSYEEELKNIIENHPCAYTKEHGHLYLFT